MVLRFLVVALVLSAVALGCVRESDVSATATPSASPAQSERTAMPAQTPTPQPRVVAANLLLIVVAPAGEEVTVMQPSVEVRGKTVLDAVVTINGKVIPVDASGEFSGDVELEPGPNTVTVVASDFQGNEQARVLTVIYVP